MVRCVLIGGVGRRKSSVVECSGYQLQEGEPGSSQVVLALSMYSIYRGPANGAIPRE
jgi:hypothetical protein